jgi:hypothetical protein
MGEQVIGAVLKLFHRHSVWMIKISVLVKVNGIRHYSFIELILPCFSLAYYLFAQGGFAPITCSPRVDSLLLPVHPGPGYPYHYAYEKASTHPGHSGSLLFVTPSGTYERCGVRKVSKSEIPVFRCCLYCLLWMIKISVLVKVNGIRHYSFIELILPCFSRAYYLFAQGGFAPINRNLYHPYTMPMKKFQHIRVIHTTMPMKKLQHIRDIPGHCFS